MSRGASMVRQVTTSFSIYPRENVISGVKCRLCVLVGVTDVVVVNNDISRGNISCNVESECARWVAARPRRTRAYTNDQGIFSQGKGDAVDLHPEAGTRSPQSLLQ